MFDESINIGDRNWRRTAQNIKKVGYSDGVTDGQTRIFQSSFDMGYSQGLDFGLALGYKLAREQLSKGSLNIEQLDNNINCQICTGQNTVVDNAVNLYNLQKEKNLEYLKDST